ncbi:Shaggy-like kinase 13 isoform 1 [Hibiscus syriacus]|uniref:Shaggy-like kinase 13 isoform 1 n=1 Tax=Hibiscus syriacus TaxID=106335 RepID=A0A6A2ZBI5_HIBSY|nr:Shaggy-like kinase 13 isoform 1 [Hibiscus syriacus]
MCKVAFLAVLLFWFSSFEVSCSEREGKQWRQSVAGGSHRRIMASRRNIGSSAAASTATFNVLDHGAKGDGRTDDTKAFQAAWDEACKVEASTVVVPSGSVFLVGPISFSGPNCQTNIVFQLDGKIIAPTSSSAWGSGLLQWIEFTKLKGITITGKGTIDGQGSVWWNDSPTAEQDSTTNETISAELKGMPSTKPTALRFYGSNGVTVTGITIQNSPQTHLKFDNCTSVQVSNFVASSPGDSPNTDGIHLQNSQDVVISATTLACGDDCVSIQTGCSNVISTTSSVDLVMESALEDSEKTTPKPVFLTSLCSETSNVLKRSSSEVETPIMIDQFYCDKSHCKNQSSAVEVSGIKYVNIRGTYTVQPSTSHAVTAFHAMEFL